MTDSATAIAPQQDDFITGRQRMTALCQSFPILRNADGVQPWDQERFARWAGGPGSTATRQAAAFVLSVWNGSCEPKEGGWWNKKPFRVGRFDLVVAWQVWDCHQKDAFLQWCENPFYP